jgi:hypothetical protein
MSRTRHTTTHEGHVITLVFDKDLVVLNQARLEVDGVQVDSTRVVYGERDLSTELDDGTVVKVRLHSGMLGELTRAQIRSGDDQWRDLTTD